MKLAPGLQIDMENLSGDAIEELCDGKVSLGFGVVDEGPVLRNGPSRAGVDGRQSPWVCIMRKPSPWKQNAFYSALYTCCT